MLNRCAVVLSPRQPYLDWAAEVGADVRPGFETPSEPGGERAVYLVPEYNDNVEAMQVLAECFDILFERELEAWHSDESSWPGNRTFRLFRDWFDVEFFPIIEDICAFALLDDELIEEVKQ